MDALASSVLSATQSASQQLSTVVVNQDEVAREQGQESPQFVQPTAASSEGSLGNNFDAYA